VKRKTAPISKIIINQKGIIDPAPNSAPMRCQAALRLELLSNSLMTGAPVKVDSLIVIPSSFKKNMILTDSVAAR
jgi:hypothetical protein